MPVQHVSSPGWVPSAQLGTTYGDNAANNAISVGFPRKVNVWLDLEGISSEVSAEAVIQYCTSWYIAFPNLMRYTKILTPESRILTPEF